MLWILQHLYNLDRSLTISTQVPPGGPEGGIDRVVRRKDCAVTKQITTQQLTTMVAASILITMPLRIFGILLFQLPLALFVLYIYCSRLRFTNRTRRNALLREMHFTQGDKIRVVGFFHPYW